MYLLKAFLLMIPANLRYNGTPDFAFGRPLALNHTLRRTVREESLRRSTEALHSLARKDHDSFFELPAYLPYAFAGQFWIADGHFIGSLHQRLIFHKIREPKVR